MAAAGWAGAIVNGLGYSWALWMACALAVALSLRGQTPPVSRADVTVGAACLVMIALPASDLSVVAATAIALWFLIRPEISVRLAGAAVILLAVAVNLLWSPAAMQFVARPVEFVDAHLVGMVTGSPAHENLVGFVDGSGALLIARGCTSVANASLALLVWLSIARSVRPRSGPRDLLVGAGVFATVMVINLTRLVLTAQDRAAYEFWHGTVGRPLVNVIISVSGLAWAAWDVRDEIFGPVLGDDTGASRWNLGHEGSASIDGR